MQKKTGELKELVDREYKGVKYVRRVETKSTSYYLLRGPVLLFSGQETFLQQAVERDKVAAGATPDRRWRGGWKNLAWTAPCSP